MQKGFALIKLKVTIILGECLKKKPTPYKNELNLVINLSEMISNVLVINN